MDQQFYRQQAQRLRDLAERADPFTRKRLLDLADGYDVKKPAPVEVRCDACNGTGFPPVREPMPGRRIYPVPCKKCGGKGRMMKGE